MLRLILTAGIISLLAACSSMSQMSSSGMPDTATMGAPGANQAFGPNGLLEGW